MAAASINDQLLRNLERVRTHIADAAQRSGRDASEVRLVAVTKRCPIEFARELVSLGQLDLGENYPQELWRKAIPLAGREVRWHLIGHLQSNKAAKTYPLVSMIHAVDSIKLLSVLDNLAETMTEPAPILLQVNCSGERSKHGWGPHEILAEATAIASCHHAPIAGLMTMAALDCDPESAKPAFAMLRQTRDRLRETTGLPLPELSMGMSNDYVAAVEEGATCVRVGSALFEGIGP